MKPIELTMVQVINNVEDERCFSILAFMKLMLGNRLITQPSTILYFVKFNKQNVMFSTILLNSMVLLQAKHIYLYDIGMLCPLFVNQMQRFLFAWIFKVVIVC